MHPCLHSAHIQPTFRHRTSRHGSECNQAISVPHFDCESTRSERAVVPWQLNLSRFALQQQASTDQRKQFARTELVRASANRACINPVHLRTSPCVLPQEPTTGQPSKAERDAEARMDSEARGMRDRRMGDEPFNARSTDASRYDRSAAIAAPHSARIGSFACRRRLFRPSRRPLITADPPGIQG